MSLCREELVQPVTNSRTATQQHGATESNGQAESAWMMNAEVQTFATSQAALWADEQFSFLEMQPDGEQEQTTSSGPCWTKVSLHQLSKQSSNQSINQSINQSERKKERQTDRQTDNPSIHSSMHPSIHPCIHPSISYCNQCCVAPVRAECNTKLCSHSPVTHAQQLAACTLRSF